MNRSGSSINGWILFFLFLLVSNVALAQKKRAKSDGLFKMLWHASHFNIYEAEQYNLKEVDRIISERDLYKPRKFSIVLSRPYLFLSSLYYKKGDFKRAEIYYNKLDSLATFHPIIQNMKESALDERSRLMIEIGDLNEAKEIIQNNISRYENLKDKRLQVCNAYSTLATFYSIQEQYDSSIYYHKKYILSMQNSWFLPFVNDMANSYSQLAEVAMKNNELKDALKYAKRGYKINSHRWAKKNNNAANYYDRINSANVVAEVYRHSGNTKKALRWNTVGYQLYNARSTRIAHYELPLLTTRALTFWANGALDSASRNFDKVTSVYFNYINDNFSYLSEFERVYFYNHSKHFIDYAKSFYLDRIIDGSESAHNKLFELSINTKGLLFNSSLKFIDKITNSTDTTILADYRKLKETKSKISTLTLAQASKEGAGNIDELNRVAKEQEKALLDRLGIEKDKFNTAKQVLDKIPADHQLVDIVKCYSTTKNKVDKKLKPVIQLSDSSAYVYFVSDLNRNKFSIDFTRQGKKLETSLYTAYRNSVRFDINESVLYKEYFQRIESLLKTRQVLYSEDGIYNLINPNVLFNGKDYLIDVFNFTSLVSSKELLQEQTKPMDISNISFFGRPDFSGYKVGDQVGYADLPGTEQEIKSIQSIIPATVNHETYLGKEANESVVKNINATSILHFATHGYFNEDNFRNPLLNSGLVLTKLNNPDAGSAFAEEDGLLTAYEASTLNLSSTSLVILSACETGLGTTVEGDGVWGLQRAFQSAGVNYIIMSLFKVDDAITAQLMTHFYDQLVQGLPINEAFKNAEKKIKETNSQAIHWGAFILKGY